MVEINDIFVPMKKIIILAEKDLNRAERKDVSSLMYMSRIEDMDQQSMLIAAPYRKGFYLPPRKGSVYIGHIAADKCSYSFKVTLENFLNDPVPLWRTSLPVDLERKQFRNYVRLDVILDVALQIMDDESIEPPVVTMTKDLSAGGMRVLMNDRIPAGTKINITLPIDNDLIVQAVGQVVRVIPPETELQKPELAVEFVKIDEKTRGRILKYIFKKQIERKKKEDEIFE